MVKVIVVRKCIDCPLIENLHAVPEEQKIVFNCATGGAAIRGKDKIDIATTDPIPEWCPLTDIEWYGWKLE